MGIFTTVVVIAAVVTVLNLFSRRDESENGRRNEPSRPSPPNPPPRPQYQPTYGTTYNPQPARQPLAPRYPYVPQPSTSTPVLRSPDVIRPTPPRSQTWSVDDPLLSADALRERASEASKLMGEAFSQSKAMRPYSPAEARKLTETGRQHKQTMEIFNKKASDMIFKVRDREPHEVDLHRLFVKEAELRVNEAIRAAETRGDPLVRFIVGQGLHTDNGVSRLKPALTSYIRKLGHPVDPDPRNPGVLVVPLNAADDQALYAKQRKPRKKHASPRVLGRADGAVPAFVPGTWDY
ncbi:hypothetical protein B0H13DRAFT_1851681 [Mycena leptocephala]|nr:hypothetical protein B0H13DRAFT_1851681 [Mycena leptocephala]